MTRTEELSRDRTIGGVLTRGLLGAVFVPTELPFGAVADGVTDDSSAIQACLNAARASVGTPFNIPVVELGGRTYAIGTQLEVPGGHGIIIRNGRLVATPDFDSTKYLLASGRTNDPTLADGFKINNLTVRDIYFDCRHRGGGLLLQRHNQIRVDSCTFDGYATYGLRTAVDGHEVMVSRCQFGEYFWGDTAGVGYTRPDLFVGTGIRLDTADNHVEDCVIRLSKVGLHVNSQANLVSRIHCWTGYVTAGVAGPSATLSYYSTGLWITSNASFNKFSQLYMDGCEVLWESPWKTSITNSLFLNGWGDASRAMIRFKPMAAGTFVSGCEVADCSFQVQASGQMLMATVDTSAGTFAAGEITDCRIGDNNFTGVTPVYSTIKTALSQSGASTWTFDLTSKCAFGAAIQQVNMTSYQFGGGTNLLRVTNVANSVVTVTSYPVATPGTPGNTNATVWIEATINKLS
jgi:hypothetical protein